MENEMLDVTICYSKIENMVVYVTDQLMQASILHQQHIFPSPHHTCIYFTVTYPSSVINLYYKVKLNSEIYKSLLLPPASHLYFWLYILPIMENQMPGVTICYSKIENMVVYVTDQLM
jgi:hypothetical protein